jgi:acetylornithine/N-succinyldiaminopimelate aminotransferase
LDKHETALELRGRGLLRGIQVQANLAEVMGLCRQKGLLIARAGTDVLRLIPPLIVSEEELQKSSWYFGCCTE